MAHMHHPRLPSLFEGLALPVLFMLAAFYDHQRMTPGPLMMALIGLLIGGVPLQRAGRLWLQQRREPLEQLPETQAALQLVPLMREFGPAKVLRANEALLRQPALVLRAVEEIRQRALPGGGDDAPR